MTEFFIRKPAFTIVLTLIVVIFGLLSFFKLPLRWIPNVSPSIVTIYTDYEGASANLMETDITTPIENALSGINGIETIYSSSTRGISTIKLTFKLGTDIDNAVQEVRNNVAKVKSILPRSIDMPVVSKADIDQMAILYLAFADKSKTENEVSDYLEQFVIPELQTLDGVALVTTYGRRASSMQILLDPSKMAISNVTVDDMNQAITQQNVEIPSGQLKTQNKYYNLITNAKLQTVDEFNNLIIKQTVDGQQIRLSNVAKASIQPLDSDSAFRVNGAPAIALGIIAQSTANPLEVASHVKKIFQNIKKTLPANMQANIVFDQTKFIDDSIKTVYEAIVEAIIFVLIVILFFLGNWRSTLIPLITIPICLIGTFTLLHLFHFSINTLTLMAIVLAVGLVVDDAIVVLENISRYIESGLTPLNASIKGSKEIIFVIIAMTFTLAAVYMPIAFIPGLIGLLFREFALTLAGSVIISGLIAMTLSPMMCSKLLSNTNHANHFQQSLKNKMQFMQEHYRSLLFFILNNKNKTLIAIIIFGLAGVFFFKALPSELVPIEDRNEVDVYASAPKDASFNYTDNLVKKLETVYKQIPNVDNYLSQVGDGSPNNSFQILNLKKSLTKKSQSIVDMLNEKFDKIPAARIMAFIPPSPISWISGSEGDSIGMAVMTSGNYKSLYASMQQLVNEVQKTGMFSYVSNRLKWDTEQFEILIDREKASNLKIPFQNITNTISTFLAGLNAGKFEFNGKQYDILLKIDEHTFSDFSILNKMYVSNGAKELIPLSNLITIKDSASPGFLPHFSRLRSDTLYANLLPQYTISDAINKLNQIAHKILPDNTKFDYMGEARNYLESNQTMILTFILAFVFIYLILVAQFESFIDPLIILVTVPFALIGAIIFLKLFKASLNIYSEIGLITLIGLIAKHGILMTEFANKALLKNVSVYEAIIEAALLRLRPILMTTFAMLLSALPLCLVGGAGSETRYQIGLVIVGGMLIGTLFSLFIVPLAYVYITTLKIKLRIMSKENYANSVV